MMRRQAVALCTVGTVVLCDLQYSTVSVLYLQHGKQRAKKQQEARSAIIKRMI